MCSTDEIKFLGIISVQLQSVNDLNTVEYKLAAVVAENVDSGSTFSATTGDFEF